MEGELGLVLLLLVLDQSKHMEEILASEVLPSWVRGEVPRAYLRAEGRSWGSRVGASAAGRGWLSKIVVIVMLN